MDAYHRYTRPPHPPPPSAVDPHYHQYQQQQQLPDAPPVPPPQAPWFSNQFQYNASHSQSPSPTPPWVPPPPHADHLNPPMPASAYPPPPPPYPGYQPPTHGQFPPRPYRPPPPQHLNSYPPQEWNNSNWAYHQNWNHPANSESEDWAARAKAWANAKAAMENPHQQAHYAPAGRQEEQSYDQIQYAQAVESQYTENHQQSPMISGYQQHAVSTPLPHGQPTHFQEHASTNTGTSSYVADGNLAYSARDGALHGDQNAAFHPERLPTNPLIHQQEVPSSYSSVSGKEEADDQTGRRSGLPGPAGHEAMHHLHAPIPTAAGLAFPYGNHDSMSNLANKPLEFTSRFNRHQDSLPQSGYAYHDSSLPARGADAAVNTWNSSMATDVPYSSIPPHLPSVSQHDPNIPLPASISGHTAPPFGRFPGSNFQPAIPSPGGPFSLSVGTALPPPTGFSADAYGLPVISERPKKAPVPSWLREEIIKTKASIASSSLGHPKHDALSAEDEGADKSLERGDQADSKSIESSRSTEEDDDDEDYVEAARTAAINQEIKRILTEVLLKVTDELFEEIATKVLSEDDAAAEANQYPVAAGFSVSPTTQAAPTPKASGKGPISVENKELMKENASEKSSSSSTGNILGLANYASDDDGEEEIHSSKQSHSIKHAMESGDEKRLKAVNSASENGISVMKVEDIDSATANPDRYSQRTSLSVSRNNDSTSVTLSTNSEMEESYHLNLSKGSSAGEFDKINYRSSGPDGVDASRSKETTRPRENLHDEDVDVRKSLMDDSRDTKSIMKSCGKDGIKRNSSRVESSKEPQSAKVKEDEKLDENHKSRDVKHVGKEKTERYDSKDTKKDRAKVKNGDKIEESERRKRSDHPDEKEDRKGRERSYRENVGDDRHRERVKDKEEDRHKHKTSRDMSKHKRRRSSSTSSRGRSSKDNSVSHAKNSSDDASDDSRRKANSRKRNVSRSPSPVKSRRRQVSRSPPHSKHSQRRHSPYSSLDSSRGRRRSRGRDD